MSEDLVAEIMKVEKDASTTKADAQQQADEILAAAQEAAASIRSVALADAQKQAEDIIARGTRVAESERARILATARQETIALEAEAASHTEAAVAFVIGQIVGRGQVIGRE